MSSEHTATDRLAAHVAGQERSDAAQFARLQRLSPEERGAMPDAACRSAAETMAARRAAGFLDPEPAPWPASTLEFLRRHMQHVGK